jgi:biofilm PGA synthesis protein PgaD
MASSPESLHINAPELLSRRRRLGDAFVTGLMWGLYSYLWAPLISLIAWLLGFEFAYDVMIRAGGLQVLEEILIWYAVMVVCIIFVVTGWSAVNRLRFAHRDRRSGGDAVGDAAMAEVFGVDTDRIADLRGTRIARLTLNDEGLIEAFAAEAPGQRDRDGQSEPSQTRNPSSSAGNTRSASIGK